MVVVSVRMEMMMKITVVSIREDSFAYHSLSQSRRVWEGVDGEDRVVGGCEES